MQMRCDVIGLSTNQNRRHSAPKSPHLSDNRGSVAPPGDSITAKECSRPIRTVDTSHVTALDQSD